MANIQITFHLPDRQEQAYIREFAESVGWTETIDDGEGGQTPNPITPAQWAKANLAAYIKGHIRAGRATAEAEAARAAAIAEVDALDIS